MCIAGHSGRRRCLIPWVEAEIVSFDRNGTLRNAGKLLRQGKLEAAIAEYVRVIEDQPADWNTANVLGDLYVRAGLVDKAIEQFVHIADTLNEEGQLVKAAAVYKKIIKLKPDFEHALLQVAQIIAGQGLYADARAYLNIVIQKRRAASDQRGATQARIMLGALDPTDIPARIEGARARLDINDVAGAVRDLTNLASELTESARYAEAIEALRQAAILQPDDEGIRAQLFDIYVSADDFGHASECATTAAQFKTLAESLELRERHEEAVQMLRRTAELDPDDKELRVQLGRTFLARGDARAAGEYLTVETAGDDLQLLLTVAEIQLRSGLIDEGLALVRRLLEEDPSRRDAIVLAGWNIAERSPDVGLQFVEIANEAAIATGDWASAAAAIQEYVTRAPNCIPALMRLVEICVDGGLGATMYSAQAQLADAHIAAGSAAEARFIAEDLVARDPWERANVERFRRALILLGEPDPEALIAERLSGQKPFMGTDLAAIEEFAEQPAPVAVAQGEDAADEPSSGLEADGDGAAAPAARRPPRRKKEEDSHFQLSANAIDLADIFGESGEADEADEADEPEPPPAKPGRARKARAEQEIVEVDLSVALGDIKREASSSRAKPVLQQMETGDDIDSAFTHLRGEASRLPGGDSADEQLKRGMALRQAGKIDESIEAFEIASHSSRHRFQASTFVGRICRERDQLPEAIEWFERAAQAPAPSAAEGHMLLYELAEALESAGEVARALAICIELQAEAGEFRDIAERVNRLAKAQTQG